MDTHQLFHGIRCLGCAIFRIVLVLIILGAGFFAMKKFAAMKKPPAQHEAQEPVFQVNAIRVQPHDIQVTLEGLGTARAKRRVSLSPQVQGQIIGFSPKLHVGNVVDASEVLVRIDPSDYEIALAQAKADLQRAKAERDRLNTAWSNDKKRLEIAQRSLELAQSDFNRVRTLFDKDEVGTQAGVEQAERQMNQQKDAVVSLENALGLYPVSLSENRARIASAESSVDRAQLNLDRTEIRAPFGGRVTFEDVDLGLVVAPGKSIVSLVDDSLLEIPVSLASKDAEIWLPLQHNPSGASWILLQDVPVRVYWVQDALERSIEGRLARVQDYDASTRTLIVIVEVQQKNRTQGFPIVEGMFCRVEIPGKTAEGVYELPAISVSHEGTVVLAKKSRVRTQAVGVVHRSGSDVLVREGLNPDDLIVTSRMAKVIEGASLELTIEPDAGDE